MHAKTALYTTPINFLKLDLTDPPMILLRVFLAGLFEGLSTWRRSSHTACLSRGDCENSQKDDM
jgi:hypothetical protein